MIYSNSKVAGILPGVNIVSFHSYNGVEYPPHVLKKALKLYEGAPVFLFHFSKNRRKLATRREESKIGFIQNVRFVEEEGIFADFYYFWQVAFLIHRQQKNIGLSHVVLACFVEKDGIKHVREIKKVYSVDLLDNPACARPFFSTGDS